jgi:hypothetical protein
LALIAVSEDRTDGGRNAGRPGAVGFRFQGEIDGVVAYPANLVEKLERDGRARRAGGGDRQVEGYLGDR